jgi:hypothetical protein
MAGALIDQLADQAEGLIGTGRVFSIRLEPGDTAKQRAGVIDAYGEVIQELRRRGHDGIRGTIEHIREGELDPDGMPLVAGEHLVIGQPAT